MKIHKFEIVTYYIICSPNWLDAAKIQAMDDETITATTIFFIFKAKFISFKRIKFNLFDNIELKSNFEMTTQIHSLFLYALTFCWLIQKITCLLQIPQLSQLRNWLPAIARSTKVSY